MFLKHVSNCSVRAWQERLWKRSLSFILLVSQLSSAVLDFSWLDFTPAPRVLFSLKFLSMVPELLAICKEDCVVKPHF